MAVAAFVLSMMALFSQLMFFMFAGARIKVELRPAILTHRGWLVRGPDGGWSKNRPQPDRYFDAENDLWVDCAEIVVSNVGRLATTVHDIGFDFTPARGEQEWRVTMRPIEISGSAIDASSARLQPGESQTVVVMPWPTLRNALDRVASEVLIVRGSARRAGKRKAVRSPQLDGWRLGKDAERLFPYVLPTKRVQVFQALAHAWPYEKIDGLYEVYLNVWSALVPMPGLDTQRGLVEILEQYMSGDVIRQIRLKRDLEELMKSPSPARVAGLEGEPRIE
ncbi:hypothetical protein [Ilumatobacter sp.]|uniref:hypothetical protein n=1 Tax=Ilumatobacter sp. TaxID=1967498 RepID=UPI003753BDBB